MSVEPRAVLWSGSGHLVLEEVTPKVAPGWTVGLLGPSASGKSSLLRLLAAIRRPAGGSVLLDGRDVAAKRRRDRARRMAVVEQHVKTEVDSIVLDVVRLGPYPAPARLGSND